MNSCTDDDFAQLIYSIRRNKCILMLGPEASVEFIDGKWISLNEKLAKELIEKIKMTDKDHINPSHLSEAAQYYQVESLRFGLENIAESFYKRHQNSVSDIHRNLAELPFSFIVHATPDLMFANALKEKGKTPTIYGYNFKGGKSDHERQAGTEQHPLLFYLYGTADYPESLVLTENDLLDFLVSVISKNPGLSPGISHELNASDKNFLFLGFGFKHWYLRILLHVLAGKGHKQSRSFALEFMPENPDDFKSTILFFKNHNTCKIHIFHDELVEFTHKLKNEFEQKKACMPTVQDQEKKPIVFICHAKANEDAAMRIFDELKNSGFDPWIDRESIKVGEVWDRYIEKTVNEDVDYFIVIESNALEERDIGYVNKEINLALKRQDYFRPGIRFILPVKIEPCEIDWLDHIQTLDLTREENMKDLISEIRKDNQRRKKRGNP